jgi:hypothetical protein
VVDKTKRVGAYDDKFRRKGAPGFFADPVEPVRNPPADAFLRNVPGVIPEAASVKVAEYDFLPLDGKQRTDLPCPPDQGFMQQRVQFGKYRV